MAISRLGEYIEYTQEPDAASITPALRAVGAAALTAAQEIIALFEYAGLPAIRGQLDQCRAALATGEDTGAIESIAARCEEVSRHAVGYIAAQQNGERREAAALVVAIQAAVAAASGETQAFHAEIYEATERFAQIAGATNIFELKTRLRAEVRTLKVKITDAQKIAQRSQEALGARVASLEVQLSASQQESSLDPLTQVFNRGAFDKRCHEWLKGGGRRFAILLIDVDDFKQFNDSLGHLEGDRVLATVAASLKEAVRSSQDVVARIGGDEFAVLAMDQSVRGGESLFLRCVRALEAAGASGEPPLPPVGLSCGVAEFSAGDSVRSLMQRADQALYEAKKRGKHQSVTREKPLLRDL